MKAINGKANLFINQIRSFSILYELLCLTLQSLLTILPIVCLQIRIFKFDYSDQNRVKFPSLNLLYGLLRHAWWSLKVSYEKIKGAFSTFETSLT